MTSATLITFLRGLDYDTRGLRADQFSVVCNDRALRRFFEFLLTNVSKEKNLVDSDELKRFDHLKSDGRALVDAQERRAWIEKKQSNGIENDHRNDHGENQLPLEWSKDLLEASRQRLQALRSLEERLSRLNQQQTSSDQKRIEAQNQLLARKKTDLKTAQIQLYGVGMKFRTASGHLAKVLKLTTPLVSNPSTISSIFFIASAADRCVLSVKQAIVQLQIAHRSLCGSNSQIEVPVIANGDWTLEHDMRLLIDGFSTAEAKWFAENSKLREAESKLERLNELEKEAAGVLAQKADMRRITQDLLADSRSIQNTVAAEMDKAVSKYSTLQSELRIAKGLHDGYQRHRDHITYLIERKGKILYNLKHQLERLYILELLLSEEKGFLERDGLQAVTKMQDVLRERLRWIKECKANLEAVSAMKRTATSVITSKSQDLSRTMLDDDSEKHSRIMMDLIGRHSQVLALHNQIALGAPELSDTLEQRGQQLRTIEESVLKYISDYESKSPT